jgi:hypothetical protein
MNKYNNPYAQQDALTQYKDLFYIVQKKETRSTAF